jgi:hypothetical protein
VRARLHCNLGKAWLDVGIVELVPWSSARKSGCPNCKSLSGHFRPDYKVFEA